MLSIRSRRLARIRPENDAQATNLAGRILGHAWNRYEKYQNGLNQFEDRKAFVNNPLWTPMANPWLIRVQRLGVRYYEYMLLDIVDDLSAAKACGLNLPVAFPSFNELVHRLDSAVSYCRRRLDELDYCLALSHT